MIELVKASIETIEELEYILNNMDQATYQKIGPMTDYSVGRHLRHIAGFYLALKACDQTGIIDYTVRQRDSLIESDLREAKAQISDIKQWLPTLINDKVIKVIAEIHQSQTVNLDIDSRLSRELAYVSEHTVHHMAYINLMLKTMNVQLDKEVGLAPSTATYLRNQKAKA